MTDAVAHLENLLHNHGKKARKGSAQCPAHDDRNESLSYTAGTKWPLAITCHAGCSSDDVLAALGASWTDFGETKKRDSGPGEIDAVYDYVDAFGRELFQVVRFIPKSFRQRHKVGGEWVWKRGNADPVLYRLPRVVDALRDGETIYVVEGEKDVHALEALGVVATCNPGGAEAWLELHDDTLDGAKHLVVVADKDDAGYKRVRRIRDGLAGHVGRIDFVRAAVGKDVADHLAAGRTLDQLEPYDPDNPTEWPEPTPLRATADPEPFPVECLPEWVQPHVRSIAGELQAPDDLPAMLALAALSTAVNGSAKVALRGTWQESLNLYLVVAMPPGAGKSPAFKALFKPLKEWNVDRATEMADEIAKAEQRLRMADDEVRKAEKAGDRHEAEMALDHKLSITIPVAPRLFVDDITPEALVPILADQGGRLALISSEGGPFEMMVGRYSESANLENYLMAWSGDDITVDRVGRGSLFVRDPQLVIGLTVQPQVIASLADRPELAGRGLTARFMYSVPPNLVGRRDLITNPEADVVAGQVYAKTIKDLAGERRAITQPDLLQVTPEARRAFLEWRQDLEWRRAPDGELAGLEEWTTKLESSVARTAGILHLADEPAHRPITTETMQRAIAIGRYWMSHAWRVHALWSPQGVVDRAERILRWIRRSSFDRFSARDVYRAGVLDRVQGGGIEVYAEPLQMLVDSNHVVGDFDGPVVLGVRGKASPEFVVNPLCRVGGHGRHGSRTSDQKQPDSAPDGRELAGMAGMALKANPDSHSLTHSVHGRTREPAAMPAMPANSTTAPDPVPPPDPLPSWWREF